jgi:hypothetical protein
LGNAAYYLLWLLAGLLASAWTSVVIVQRLQWRALRQLKAIELLDALARYTQWVSAQGRAVFFHGPTHDSDSALQEIGSVQEHWFPHLQPQAQELFAVHIRLTRFLRSQQRQRLRDAEAWFESDPDEDFMPLWREHCRAAQELERRLAPAAGCAGALAEFTSAA